VKSGGGRKRKVGKSASLAEGLSFLRKKRAAAPGAIEPHILRHYKIPATKKVDTLLFAAPLPFPDKRP